MLRLIHTQTVQGALLVDDIDDGLPNKLTHRLGSTGDPKAYKRDGYANEPKQPCYIPRVSASNAALPGYIDLNETPRVQLSAAQGKIAGLQRDGKITVVSLVAADLATPVISSATMDAPAAGDVTIAGSGFLSVSPNVTSVRVFGAGVGDVTLTQSQITGVAPGAVGATSIVIDSTLLPGLVDWDAATATLTGSGTFSDGETVTIGGKAYTMQTVLTNVDGNVLIGADLTASLANLRAAINLAAGGGTTYAAATTLHPTVTATSSNATTMVVAAKTMGVGGNAITTAETAANAAWSGPATLGGGVTGDQIIVTADGQASNTANIV